MKHLLTAMALLALTACAGVPDPPACTGDYRSLNPTHYTLKGTTNEGVETTISAG